MDNQGKPAKHTFLPIIGLFIFVGAILRLLMVQLESNGVNTFVLQTGNLFLFLIFMVSVWLQRKGMDDKSTHVFLRNVYGGMLLKLFGGAIAAFVYIYLSRGNINKPALFGTMFLYMVYTVIELKVVLKKSKST